MTLALTSKHGCLDDGDSASGWNPSVVGLAGGDYSIEVDNATYLKVMCKPDADPDNEYVVYQKQIATNFSSTTYPNYLVRWKTSDTTTGVGAILKVMYDDDATTETLVGPSPQFSDTWTVSSGTLDSGNTIKHLQIIADDSPDTTSDGVEHYVYVDYFFFYGNEFSFPHLDADNIEMPFPLRQPILGIPSKGGDITQNLGTENNVIRIRGLDLTKGDWLRDSNDKLDGELFLDMVHNSASEPWQWLKTGPLNPTTTPDRSDSTMNFKVTVHPVFRLSMIDGAPKLVVDLELREYTQGDKNQESHRERWGIGL